MSRSVLLVLLLCASASVAARDNHMDGANNDGGHCPDASTVADADAPANKPVRATHAAVKPAKPAKVTPTVRSGDSDAGPRIQAPRWHSFLPGMFR